MHTARKRLLVKSLPRSESISFGDPYLQITSSTNTFATVLAVISGNGNISTHFVNQSVTTKMCLLPFTDFFKGPNVSITNRSYGPTISSGFSGGFVRWRGPFRN